MDAEEFDACYTISFSRVVNQVHALIGDRDEAQDCVQEAFVRAWSHRGRLDVTAHPEAWVRSTAYHLAVSRWRRVVRSRRSPDRALQPLGDQPPPDEARVELLRALGQLPPDQRRALVLHHLCDIPVSRGRRRGRRTCRHCQGPPLEGSGDAAVLASPRRAPAMPDIFAPLREPEPVSLRLLRGRTARRRPAASSARRPRAVMGAAVAAAIVVGGTALAFGDRTSDSVTAAGRHAGCAVGDPGGVRPGRRAAALERASSEWDSA